MPSETHNKSSAPVALITGASSGLGRALCLALASKGVHIIALARSILALETLDDEIAQKTQSNATLVKMDLNDSASLQTLALSIAQRFGRLDYFIHAAALMPPLGPTAMLDKKQWQNCMQVNTGCLVDMLDGLTALMRQQDQAKLVFFDDPITQNAQPFWGAYAASKAALRALVQSLSAELSSSELSVELLEPAPMASKLRGVAFPGEDRSLLNSPEAIAQQLLAKILIKP